VSLTGFDGDGREDVVATGGTPAEGQSPTPEVFLQDAWGRLDAPKSYVLPFESDSIAIGDVNGDSQANIVAASPFYY
jgi:hypothetical protein